ncbi:hypothetical protein K466DRAFT_506330, partial [Polyporus arcularius HHB13444]
TALLVFEWAITFGREVDLYWRDKFSVATILFLLNRYMPIVYIASSFAGGLVTSDAVSDASRIVSSIALDLLQYVPWTLFSTLRVYAICGRRWYLAAPILLFSGFPIILNLLHYHWEHGEIIPVLGCVGLSTLPPELSIMYVLITIVSRSSLIMADALVVLFTWLATYNSVRIDELRMNLPTFSKLLLVDGTFYFVILTVLHAMHLVLTILSIAVADSQTSYIIAFTEPITAIFVSRFLMNLQAVKRRNQHQQSLDSFQPSVEFSRVLGAIESTLRPDDFWPPSGEVPGENPAGEQNEL